MGLVDTLSPAAVDFRSARQSWLVILTPTDGDRRVPWDPSDPAQLDEARRKFSELVGSGYRAYRVARRGVRGERIHEFDPLAGEILFTGQHGYVGG